ncbi:MAG: Trp family transcriptional regulator [Patescibacteria group bacterium]
MRRYKFLLKEEVFEALNKLRAAFLAAKDGNEVEEIIRGILTSDERIKIGRRILISQLLDEGLTFEAISKDYRIGKQTALQVQKLKDRYPKCFELISQRVEKVEIEFGKKAYIKTGNPKYLKKFIEYTGFKRTDVKR